MVYMPAVPGAVPGPAGAASADRDTNSRSTTLHDAPELLGAEARTLGGPAR
jgi:hypothetical protein